MIEKIIYVQTPAIEVAPIATLLASGKLINVTLSINCPLSQANTNPILAIEEAAAGSELPIITELIIDGPIAPL
jgi:hypothetical protein